MKKYWEVFKIAWQQNLIYRFNFFLWRVRNVLQLILIYFIWWSVFQSQVSIFGYTISSIITYILIASLLRAIVLSSRVTDLIDSINSGNVVNFLIKPLGLIKYYLARDVADKLFNIFFYIFEIALIVLIFRPQIIIQTNIFDLMLFILSIIGALIIYFSINFIISLTSFWMENSWGPLFLMAIFLEGFGGSLFPLDIFPKFFFNILMLTPFPYLIYFPAKLYLGGMSNLQIFSGFVVMIFWMIALLFLMRIIIQAGFRHFSAVGN